MIEVIRQAQWDRRSQYIVFKVTFRFQTLKIDHRKKNPRSMDNITRLFCKESGQEFPLHWAALRRNLESFKIISNKLYTKIQRITMNLLHFTMPLALLVTLKFVNS